MMRTINLSTEAEELLEQCGAEFNITDGFMLSRLVENCLASPDKAREHLGLEDVFRYAVYALRGNELAMTFPTNDRELAISIALEERKQSLARLKKENNFPINVFTWTEEQKYNWDVFILYNGAFVAEYDYETEEYLTGDIWFGEELKAIGWMSHDELLREKLKELQKGM